MVNRKNIVAFVKKLKDEGLIQKQIRLITKIPQSTLSRILNNQTYIGVKPNDYQYDDKLEARYKVFQIISSCKEIPGSIGLDEENKRYIKTLRFIGVEFEKVKELYYDIGKKQLTIEWLHNNVDFRQFNSELLGIRKKDFEDLIDLK